MSRSRAAPPPDISPEEFFTRWVPANVEADAERREHLSGVTASIRFEITSPVRSVHTVHITDGRVRGAAGSPPDPDLAVELDEATWRELNGGDMSAPEALLRRRLRLHGDWLLALRLHWILS